MTHLTRRVFVVGLAAAAAGLKPAGAAQGAALLGGSFERRKGNFFKTISVYPMKVDGKPLSKKLFDFAKFKPVAAGAHVVKLSVRFQTGFNEYPYEGHTTVKAAFKAGRRYVTVGAIADRDVSFWIKDEASGKRVSNVSTLRLGDCWIGGLFCPPEWIS